MKFKIFVFMVALLMATISFSQETYYNRTVEVDDSPGYVVYDNTFTVLDTITATVYYSEAFKNINAFSDATDSVAWSTFEVAGTTTGTEDINVFVEYADDPDETNTRWAARIDSTQSALDAVGTTIVQHKIGLNPNAGNRSFKHNKFPWMRLKYVLGQANNAGKIIKASVKFKKPLGLMNQNIGRKASTPDS